MNNDWFNEHHRILFTLLILESNNRMKNKYTKTCREIQDMIVKTQYPILWEDRAICEEILTRSEYNSRLHQFRLKHDSWNWDKDFTPHMWRTNE